MLTETLIKALPIDEGGTVLLSYRCRACSAIFTVYGSPEVESDFRVGRLLEKALHSCETALLYRGVTGVADLLGWEKVA